MCILPHLSMYPSNTHLGGTVVPWDGDGLTQREGPVTDLNKHSEAETPDTCARARALEAVAQVKRWRCVLEDSKRQKSHCVQATPWKIFGKVWILKQRGWWVGIRGGDRWMKTFPEKVKGSQDSAQSLAFLEQGQVKTFRDMRVRVREQVVPLPDSTDFTIWRNPTGFIPRLFT